MAPRGPNPWAWGRFWEAFPGYCQAGYNPCGRTQPLLCTMQSLCVQACSPLCSKMGTPVDQNATTAKQNAALVVPYACNPCEPDCNPMSTLVVPECALMRCSMQPLAECSCGGAKCSTCGALCSPCGAICHPCATRIQPLCSQNAAPVGPEYIPVGPKCNPCGVQYRPPPSKLRPWCAVCSRCGAKCDLRTVPVMQNAAPVRPEYTPAVQFAAPVDQNAAPVGLGGI